MHIMKQVTNDIFVKQEITASYQHSTMHNSERTIIQFYNKWMIHIGKDVALHFCSLSVTN